MERKMISPIRVYGEDFRHEVAVMCNVITELKLWNWLKNENPPENPPCYFLWNHPNIDIISIHPKISECGHSGVTEALCLRITQKIARQGLENVVLIGLF